MSHIFRAVGSYWHAIGARLETFKRPVFSSIWTIGTCLPKWSSWCALTGDVVGAPLQHF